MKVCSQLSILFLAFVVTLPVFAGTNELNGAVEKIARRVVAEKNLRASLKEIEKAIAANPNADDESKSQAYLIQAEIYRRSGDLKEAERLFQWVAKKYPNTIGGSSARYALEKYFPSADIPKGPAPAPASSDDVYADCIKAINEANSPKGIEDQVCNAMTVLCRRKQCRDCDNIYTKFIAKFGMTRDTKQVVIQKVYCLYYLGKNNDAIKLLNEVFDKFAEEKRNEKYLILMAKLQIDSGSCDEANKWLSIVATIDDSDPALYIQRGRISQSKQNYTEAKGLYEKAKALAEKQNNSLLVTSANSYLGDIKGAFPKEDEPKNNKFGALFTALIGCVFIGIVGKRLLKLKSRRA